MGCLSPLEFKLFVLLAPVFPGPRRALNLFEPVWKCVRVSILNYHLQKVDFLPLLTGVGPASVMVGNLVAGKRIAQAAGRDLGQIEENDLVRKVSVREVLIFTSKSKTELKLQVTDVRYVIQLFKSC